MRARLLVVAALAAASVSTAAYVLPPSKSTGQNLSADEFNLVRSAIIDLDARLAAQEAGPGSGTTTTPNYFFSTSGSDSNDCASASTPCASLSKVATVLGGMSAGQILAFKRGDVWTGTLTITNRSGTAGNPILLTAYGSGALPTIDASGAGSEASPMDVLRIYGTSSYLTIDSLHLRNVHDFGVRLQDSTHHIVVQNSEIGPTMCGGVAMGQSAYSQVLHNNIHDIEHMCVVGNGGSTTGYGGEGIDVGGTYQEVGWNTIAHARAVVYVAGVADNRPLGDGGCIELFGPVQHLSYHHNFCDDAAAFVEMNGDGIDDVLMHHNIIRGPSAGGGQICMHSNPTHDGGYLGLGPITNVKMDNNVFAISTDFVGTETGNAWISCTRGATSPILFLTNNIHWLKAGQYLAFSGEAVRVSSNYNIYRWDNGATNYTYFTAGAQDLTSDPLFVDRAGGDFKLATGSPAIDSGSARTYTTSDYAGITIPQGVGPDRGAHER